MYTAEGDGALARGLGNFFVWIWDLIFHNLDKAPVVLLGAAGVFLLWRISIIFGPFKKCWRCTGKGYVGGLLGGKRKCWTCAGSGYRSRVGSGK